MTGAYAGAVIATKKGSTLVMFHLMCEDDFYNDVMRDALGIVNSLAWGNRRSELENCGANEIDLRPV